jgi:hypothetical protein
MRAGLSIIVSFVVSIAAASQATACMYPTVYFSPDSAEVPERAREALDVVLWAVAKRREAAPNCPIEVRLFSRFDGAEATAGRTTLDVVRAGSVVAALRERLKEIAQYTIIPLGFDQPFIVTPPGVADPQNRSVEIRVGTPADGRRVVCEGPASSCGPTCVVVMEDGSKCPR